MSKIFRISKSRNPEGDFAGGSGIGKTPLAFVKANSADEAWTKFSQVRKVKDYNRMGYEITDIDDPRYSGKYKNEYERFKNHTDVKANPSKYIIEGRVMPKFGLSSRKQLLKEAEEELKNIRRSSIKEVTPRIQNSPELVSLLKECIADYDSACKKAITEFKSSKKVLEAMLNKIQSVGGIGEAELQDRISDTWIEDYSSGVSNARSAIQRFESVY